MNCGTCKHWSLDGNLAQHGYGHCAARTDPQLRAGITTSAQTICRIGKFAKAKPDEIRQREHAQNALL